MHGIWFAKEEFQDAVSGEKMIIESYAIVGAYSFEVWFNLNDGRGWYKLHNYFFFVFDSEKGVTSGSYSFIDPYTKTDILFGKLAVKIEKEKLITGEYAKAGTLIGYDGFVDYCVEDKDDLHLLSKIMWSDEIIYSRDKI
jgi:hypothetical protein